MVREIIQFSQTLGHGECNFLCDNEPSIMQVQKRAVQARRAMGLMTHSKTPAADTHENTPAFAYTHAALKGNPRWQRVIVLGKTETQDTYVVFTGSTIMLTRSVRRIATDWKCHLGFYLHFNSPTLRFKAGLGGRIIPTKRSVEGQSASFAAPQTAVLPSPVHDKDAEDVKRKMLEERTEERETLSMGQEDKPLDDTVLRQGDKAGDDVVLVEPSSGLHSSVNCTC